MSEIPDESPDDELTAYHEAGHAVAMWKLGLGIGRVTIEPAGDLLGSAEPAREYVERENASLQARRFMVEQNVLYLHAGDVAARLLRPGVGLRHAHIDHDRIHEWMYGVADDGSVHITWCNYLWQRAYELLAWPGRWYLVVGLARQLLEHRTLAGAEAERYLRRAQEDLQYDPRMPNAVLVGEVTCVCSPWHRRWYEQSIATTAKPKRTDVPETIAGLTAKADVRPVTSALAPLPTRAQRCLQRAGIRTVADLEDWNESTLGAVGGAGRKTVREIVDAAALAGVRMAAPGQAYPRRLNPGRWRLS